MKTKTMATAMRPIALALFLVTTCQAWAQAGEWAVGGTVFNYDATNGVATITHGSYSGELEIPTAVGTGAFPVVAVGSGAFEGSDALTGVTIPSGVTNIASRAFANCTALEYVAILDPAAKVAADAFTGCASIAVCVLPPAISGSSASLFPNSPDACAYRADRIDSGAARAVMRGAKMSGFKSTLTPGVCRFTIDTKLEGGADATVDTSRIRVLRAATIEEVAAMPESAASHEAIAGGINARDTLAVRLRVSVDTSTDGDIPVTYGEDEIVETESPNKRYFKITEED